MDVQSDTRRRGAQRYTIALTVELPGVKAVTRDVSSDGIYFLAPPSFSPTVEIEFTLVLPEAASEAAPVRLQCRARVVRTEELQGQVGVAARFDEFGVQPTGRFVWEGA